MESTLSRNRNLRNSYSKRKKGLSLDDGRVTRIIKQLIISAAIFVVFLTVKNINTNASNYLSNQISNVLTYDIETNRIIDSVKSFVSSLNITNEKLKSVFKVNGEETNNNESIIPDDMKDKVSDGAVLKGNDYQKPLDGIVMSSFGERVDPITNEKAFHEGIDLNAKDKQEIMAIDDGIILEAKNSPSLGNYVKIKHEDDVYTLYAHASEITVKEGDEIKKGDIVAKAGSTGDSTGVHLHFEMRQGDKLIDPQTVFDFSK